MKISRKALLVALLLWSAFIQTYSQTCVPQQVTSNSVSAERAVIIWDVLSDASQYEVRIRESGGSWLTPYGLTQQGSNSDTSYVWEQLVPCTEYEIQVRAKCNGVWGDYSNSPIIDAKTACSILPDDINLQVKSTFMDGDVIVRWAPANYSTWKWGNINGYTLERYTISINGSRLSDSLRFASTEILDSTLLPLPEWEWKAMADTSDFAGIAVGSIYGDSLEMANFDSVNIEEVFSFYQQDENRFAMSLFAADQEYQVAKSMGLAFKDTTVISGREYLYVVRINNVPDTVAYEPGISFQNTNDPLFLPPPVGLKALPGDSSAVLFWDKSRTNEFYTSFKVEKSSDNGATFEELSALPVIGTEESGDIGYFGDSLANNNTTFIYRVRGVSPFGVLGPYSDTVHVKGRPSPVTARPSIGKGVETASGEMKITWTFPSNFLNKIVGFDIYRSQVKETGYQKLTSTMLSTSTTEYIDTSPIPVAYYYVEATDVNGYTLQSNAQLAQLKDETPPAAPVSLQCPCDSTGMVTITWAKGSEPDLMGYRVFTSTAEEDDYVVLSKMISDTFFYHQIDLNTLSEKVYFKVIAFDLRENQSLFSASCKADRPDIIPPSPANITYIEPTNNNVFFRWIPSSSEDVVEHKFQRRIITTHDWETLLTFPGVKQTEFLDTTASYRKTYQYRLLAFDEVGNFSSSIIVEAKPVDNGIRDSIENFTAYFMDLVNQVQLSWDYQRDPELAGFQVYRAVNYNTMTPYEYVTVQEALDQGNGPGEYGFVDTDVRNLPPTRTTNININRPPGTPSGTGLTVSNPPNPSNPLNVPPNYNVVMYRVMAEFTDGAFSPFTDIVAVVIPIR